MSGIFQLQQKDTETEARAGVIQTAHGEILTPCFMPVGTQATVKSLDAHDLAALAPPVILANTYHLALRPGAERIAQLGGLHQFMNWPHPILTDSGGFQVFSLGLQKNNNLTIEQLNNAADVSMSDHTKLVTIDEEGVTFRSHIDGSRHRFTPESAIEIQHQLGADIIMAFDECTPDTATREYTIQAMERTHRWALRSLEYHNKSKKQENKKTKQQLLFGIIQGGQFADLRKQSTQYIASLDFDGIAVGGETTGYNMSRTIELLDWIRPFIPTEKPHYIMGVGISPLDCLRVVASGMDMFDCVAPTRLARTGTVFARERGNKNKFRLDITHTAYALDTNPIEQGCPCLACTTYTRAYIHHLFRAQELLAYRLATIHNVSFFLRLMSETRAAILDGRFKHYWEEWEKS